MKVVSVLSLLFSVFIYSNAAVIPTSQIAFDDFAKHDVAADVAREVTTDEDFDMDAVFSSFAASVKTRAYEESAMESPEADDLEPSTEPLLTIATLRKIKEPLESPEELMPSSEDIDFSVREEVMASPDDLEATPEYMFMMSKRRAGPVEMPEETIEASIEPEVLDGLMW